MVEKSQTVKNADVENNGFLGTSDILINERIPNNPRKSIINKTRLKTVPFHHLFRFSVNLDLFLIFTILITSACVGLAYPLNIMIFKSLINILVIPLPNYSDRISRIVYQFAILASGSFIAGFVQMICISLVASRQSLQYKNKLFTAFISQDVSWFDRQQTGKMITKITDDVETIESAISDKLAQIVQQLSLFFGSIAMAASVGWKLTLVGCVSIPIMCVVFFCVIHFVKRFAIQQVKAYSMAGGIAEEIISSVRTVMAYNAQQAEVARYTVGLKTAESLGIKKGICQGIGLGCTGFTIYGVGALVFYVGLNLIVNENYQPGIVFQVFLTIVIGSISLGAAIPVIEHFISAVAAAFPIFEVIDRIPEIDITKKGIIPDSFCENITFSDVTFEYPTRPGVSVLKKFNFTIPFGKTVAFIGPSGSGKSTIIHLLQRFYDPVVGKVTLNDINLRDIDLAWYRSNIGVVQQEPVLFSGTIRDNIKFGKLTATEAEITKAARDANAYEFINQTPHKFDTVLGDRGAGFSGGQKQRIAIAAALVRDPHLLLLDEATSALDNKSEKLVQAAIDKTIAERKYTVVMVAHRLHTVRNADIIVVMKHGSIVEQGNHSELLQQKGVYWKMLESQKCDEKTDHESEKESDIIPLLTEETVEYLPDELTTKPANFDEAIKSKDKLFLRNLIRLMRINKGEAGYLIVGIMSSMITGFTFPVAALLYAEMFQIISSHLLNKDQMLKNGYFFCALLLIPASVLLIFQTLKLSCLGKAGETLTTKIRSLMLASMLKQEIAWFDEPQNLPGILTARLALEASLVKGAAGIQCSVFVEAASNIILSLVFGFYFSWQLTLLFLIFIPIIILLGILQGKLATGQRLSHHSTISSNAFVLEILNNIRAVMSFGLQEHFADIYSSNLKLNRSTSKLLLYGCLNGLANSALLFSYCAVFYVGAILIDKKYIVMIQLMRVFSCFTISASYVGRVIASTPDTAKATEATHNALTTIDRKTAIDCDSGFIPETKLTGNIEFRNIFFSYPSRPKVPVLKNFSVTVNARENIAFVGHSGCGKSTVVQLLERYYDPSISNYNEGGQILLDGHDLKVLNLSWVRSQIGLVKQDPALFNISILNNIIYGQKEQASVPDVIAVAKLANIHEFIESLPEGYQTVVGPRGGHLSGGQKQRICIARALYKKPSILLFDEATSSLDTECEILVQEALDKAQTTSTSLVIAHRLSTIRNSDKIIVIENGKVIESGKHQHLMDLRGFYYDLNMELMH